MVFYFELILIKVSMCLFWFTCFSNSQDPVSIYYMLGTVLNTIHASHGLILTIPQIGLYRQGYIINSCFTDEETEAQGYKVTHLKSLSYDSKQAESPNAPHTAPDTIPHRLSHVAMAYFHFFNRHRVKHKKKTAHTYCIQSNRIQCYHGTDGKSTFTMMPGEKLGFAPLSRANSPEVTFSGCCVITLIFFQRAMRQKFILNLTYRQDQLPGLQPRWWYNFSLRIALSVDVHSKVFLLIDLARYQLLGP